VEAFMGKRRVIDSKIRVSQSFSKLSYRQRDLWQGLIATADDQGRQPGQSAYIRSAIWPYDDISIGEVEADLQALETVGYIVRYAVEDQTYLQIVNWWKYQQSQWMSPSDYPPPKGWVDRCRYHGRKNAIIEANWNQDGGFCNNQDSGLDSNQDSSLDSNQDTHAINPAILPREEGDGEDELMAVATAPAAPPPDSRNEVRRSLETHFLERTGLPAPRAASARERRAAGSLWWAPLREIAELAGWDVDVGRRLIDISLRRLDGMTVSDPNSIIKTARAVSAENKGSAGEHKYAEVY
jgi:hypothetical protein